jgi:hypothetical protein
MKILLTVVLIAAACALLGLTVIATQSPPKITRPVMFDTPEADRILAALQVFPPDNPWNQDISMAPVHANSAAIIASIGKDKHIDFNLDMNYIIVPPNQPRVPVKIKDYPDEAAHPSRFHASRVRESCLFSSRWRPPPWRAAILRLARPGSSGR